ncbi:MAG: DUF1801 domain-containing protein [Chitinophagaceae bacterium]
MNAQVDAYIDALADIQQEIATIIRDLLWNNVNGLEEKFSFKIPFYHYFGMFCYIKTVPNGIELCFCRGKDLVLAFPKLSMLNRTLIAGVTITNKKDIISLEIASLIQEAAALQITMHQFKKYRTAKRKKRL